MNQSDIDIIRDRSDRATKGPYIVSGDGYTICSKDDGAYLAQVHPYDHRKSGNVNFFAHSWQDITDLLAELQTEKDKNHMLNGEVDDRDKRIKKLTAQLEEARDALVLLVGTDWGFKYEQQKTKKWNDLKGGE